MELAPMRIGPLEIGRAYYCLRLSSMTLQPQYIARLPSPSWRRIQEVPTLRNFWGSQCPCCTMLDTSDKDCQRSCITSSQGARRPCTRNRRIWQREHANALLLAHLHQQGAIVVSGRRVEEGRPSAAWAPGRHPPIL